MMGAEPATYRAMAAAAHEPRDLRELLAWFRREWDREVPRRVHERGVEPDSAIGSPRLAGAFRSYLMGSPFATDHDDRLDIDRRDATRLYPIHAAIVILSRRWPLSGRFAFLLGISGSNDWEAITLSWHMLPEVGHRFAEGTLRHLWDIWDKDRMRVV
jgi:hypothetical protein